MRFYHGTALASILLHIAPYYCTIRTCSQEACQESQAVKMDSSYSTKSNALHSQDDEETAQSRMAEGNHSYRLYKKTGDLGQLDDAIRYTTEGSRLISQGHESFTKNLIMVAALLEARYERSGDMRDLEEAIGTARRSVQSTPPSHPDLAGYLNNLGAWLGTRFERSGETKDLEEAIDTARRAVQSTPPDHPNLAMYLNNLGAWLGRRFERIGEMKDLEEVVQCYQQAFSCIAAVPLERVKAVARCLNNLADLHKTHEAAKLGRDALALLPIVNNRNLDRGDQQFVLSGFSGIASDLCALLLSQGRLHEAVECLEQGRAIIISRLLDDRSDVSGLFREHPKLAQRYQSLVEKINEPLVDSGDNSTMTSKVVRRREVATELEICLQDIRATPSHDRFLLGQTVAQMQEDMCEGCIVMVNVSTIGSHAIVMTQGTLQVISLSGLNVEDARRWLRTEWRSKKRSELRKKNNEFLEFLTWLWHSCVKGILDHISTLHERQDQPLPRVWWIGCGLASSMPFHAAGIHVNLSRDNALSKVISSYTPSVKALGYARSQIKHTRDDQPTQDQMLITLMPGTPQGANDKTRFKPLEGVPAEEEKITEIVTPHVSLVVRTRPAADDILGQLEKCQISHFACHGMSNLKDPSSSGLVLQRFASDGTLEQDHLSVYRISQLQLRHAKIAYLSACSTAENKSARLQDEVIHIVSGFQVAGFPHVIGSLWPAGDRECVEVASGFYKKLFENGNVSDVGSRRVACALQEAVMAVRANDMMDRPLDWAQFVHFGA
jgi:tetratricopeptide (TPR) repeat protein